MYSLFSELFVKENGDLVTEGDILLRPKMAATLRTIASDPEAFYNPTSQLAQDIVADIAEYGTIIALNYTFRRPFFNKLYCQNSSICREFCNR